jgi:hypothetical protein
VIIWSCSFVNLAFFLVSNSKCHNLNIRLVTKARACEGVGQEWSPTIMFHVMGVWESVREWTPTFPSELPLWELEFWWCRNPSFGLATKAKGLQRCGPRGSSGVTSHTPESVGKCEGVNPHTPKATPTLGEKSHLDVGPVERSIIYYKGEGGGFPPKSGPWWVLCVRVAYGSS